jgi:hypothetical protein
MVLCWFALRRKDCVVVSDRSYSLIEWDKEKRPKQFPTHHHAPDLWEQLGRVVASYGCLEEVLFLAIVSVSGSETVPETEAEEAVKRWELELQAAMKSPLGALINKFEEVLKKHPNVEKVNVDELITELRKVSAYRNPLCHGSWRMSDERGFSKVSFVDRKLRSFETPLDVGLLKDIQAEIGTFICHVCNTVVLLGCKPIVSKSADKPS